MSKSQIRQKAKKNPKGIRAVRLEKKGPDTVCMGFYVRTQGELRIDLVFHSVTLMNEFKKFMNGKIREFDLEQDIIDTEKIRNKTVKLIIKTDNEEFIKDITDSVKLNRKTEV
jgi:hypothetical protein